MKDIKKIKKRYIIGVLVLVTIITLILIKASKPIAYTNYTVTTQTVSDELLLAGTINAPGRVDLGFAAGGRIDKINVKTGDRVKKGQLIAQVAQNGLLSNLIQAQANYALTKVNTNNTVKTAGTSYESLKLEQDIIVDNLYSQYISGDLVARDASGRDKIKSAPIISGNFKGKSTGIYTLDMFASASDSGYSYRLSGIESGTYTAFTNQPAALGTKGLFVQFETNTSYNNTQWVVEIPNTRSATYLSRKNAYENALATRERILTDAKNNLESVAGVNGSSTSSAAQAQRNQAGAQINAVYTQLNDGKITAPFDGIVAKIDLEIGQIVNAFSPVVVMFEDNTKELELNVPEIYINKVKLDDIVNISLDAYPDITIEGRVSFIDLIDTQVDGVPVYKTKIELDDKDDRIRVGMNAKARIIAEEKDDVLAIPQHYIRTNENGDTVVDVKNILSEDEIEERIVLIGLKGNNGLVEILSGLSGGEIIAVKEA